jgi:hypothetical protein
VGGHPRKNLDGLTELARHAARRGRLRREADERRKKEDKERTMISDVQAFALTVHTGTDAFKPEPTGELARILREIAEQIEVGREYG